MALVTLLGAATAGAKGSGQQRKSTPRHGARCKLVHRASKPRVVRVCKRNAAGAGTRTGKTTPPAGSVGGASKHASIASGTVPAAVVTTTAPEVHAAVGAGFAQNPLVPNEVTWHYSASA